METFESVNDTDPVDEPVIDDGNNEFTAGLNSVYGVEEAQEIATEEIAVNLIAGMTEAEVTALLDKARLVDSLNERLTSTHDRAFGRIGSLEQQIGELKAARQANPVNKESFKAIMAYFDDDQVAEALAQDLSNLNMGAPIVPEVDYEAIAQIMNDRIGEVSKEFEVKLLTIQHPDWRDITQTEQYGQWKATLSEQAQEILANSWDGQVISTALTTFKKWGAAKEEAAATKAKRLEDAVQVQGNTRKRASEDEFMAGMKKVLG